MLARRDEVVVAATLDHVRNGWAIDLQIGARFQPKFAVLITIRRPPGRPADLPNESPEKKTRMRTNLLM